MNIFIDWSNAQAQWHSRNQTQTPKNIDTQFDDVYVSYTLYQTNEWWLFPCETWSQINGWKIELSAHFHGEPNKNPPTKHKKHTKQ